MSGALLPLKSRDGPSVAVLPAWPTHRNLVVVVVACSSQIPCTICLTYLCIECAFVIVRFTLRMAEFSLSSSPPPPPSPAPPHLFSKRPHFPSCGQPTNLVPTHDITVINHNRTYREKVGVRMEFQFRFI